MVKRARGSAKKPKLKKRYRNRPEPWTEVILGELGRPWELPDVNAKREMRRQQRLKMAKRMQKKPVVKSVSKFKKARVSAKPPSKPVKKTRSSTESTYRQTELKFSPAPSPVQEEFPQRPTRSASAKAKGKRPAAAISSSEPTSESGDDEDEWVVDDSEIAEAEDEDALADAHEESSDPAESDSEYECKKRPRNNRVAASKAGASTGAKNGKQKTDEKCLETLRSLSSQLKQCEDGRLSIINTLKAIQKGRQDEEDAQIGESNSETDMRVQQLKKLQEELAKAGSAPVLDAGQFQSAMAKHLNISVFNPTDLPTISKAYEESQMYAADERTVKRPCVNQLDCICYKLALAKNREPFVMQEFLYPHQQQDFDDTCTYPAVRQECLMCMRFASTLNYTQLKLTGSDAKVMIVSHWNRCDTEGEYSSDICYMPPSNRSMGVVCPVVPHDESIYTYVYDEDPSKNRVTHVDAVNFRVASTV